jgi:quercetin 2,3-dioxygenase
MITLRRATERHHEQRRKQEAWLTFHAKSGTDPFSQGFGTLEILKEGRLPPHAGIRQPRQNSEIITYVHEGTLAYEDSLGQSGLIRAGEFQRMTAGSGMGYSETNTSPTHWAHIFQIWLRPSTEKLTPGHEQKRFSIAARRGILCVVASADGRNGSLKIHQDAMLCSAILKRGQHVVHELLPGRSAWLHVVHGEVAVNHGAVTLQTGDGVGVTSERALSLTATEPAEVLLLDLKI